MENGAISISPMQKRCPAWMRSTRASRLACCSGKIRNVSACVAAVKETVAHHFASKAAQRRQAADMVEMFVGNNDAVEPVGGLFVDRQAAERFALAEARIHQ